MSNKKNLEIKVHVYDGRAEEHEITLKRGVGGTITIGRDSKSHIRIHADKGVGKRHANIEVGENDSLILRSVDGGIMALNGVSVEEISHNLVEGDVIRVGSSHVTLLSIRDLSSIPVPSTLPAPPSVNPPPLVEIPKEEPLPVVGDIQEPMDGVTPEPIPVSEPIPPVSGAMPTQAPYPYAEPVGCQTDPTFRQWLFSYLRDLAHQAMAGIARVIKDARDSGPRRR